MCSCYALVASSRGTTAAAQSKICVLSLSSTTTSTGTFHPYTDSELLALDKHNFTAEEMEEYNKDWGSSAEKHTSFDNVIESHDFTFINFYAGWCHHCRMFAPEWDKFEKEANSKPGELVDSNGSPVSVRVIKINCVDFVSNANMSGSGNL